MQTLTAHVKKERERDKKNWTITPPLSIMTSNSVNFIYNYGDISPHNICIYNTKLFMYCICKYQLQKCNIYISVCKYVKYCLPFSISQRSSTHLLKNFGKPLKEMRGKNYERKIILNVKFPRFYPPSSPPPWRI